jgi:hypothetical protein
MTATATAAVEVMMTMAAVVTATAEKYNNQLTAKSCSGRSGDDGGGRGGQRQ